VKCSSEILVAKQ